jgi:hypothetical protein
MPGDFGYPFLAPHSLVDGEILVTWPASHDYYLGGLWQHSRSSEAHIATIANTTRVPNYESPADPATIPPYPRPATGGANPSGGDCPGVPNPIPSNPPATGEAPYGPWPLSDRPSGTIDNNSYAATGNYVDYSKCRKMGCKGVQARKVHHGIIGWLDRYYRDFAGEGSTPVTTRVTSKYLTQTYVYVLRDDQSESPYDPYDAQVTITFTATVDRYSGLTTTTYTEVYNDAALALGWDDENRPTLLTIDFGANGFTELPLSAADVGGLAGYDMTSGNPGDYVYDVVHADAVANNRIAATAIREYTSTYYEGETPITWTKRVTWTQTRTLSGAYTEAMLQADANELLDEWDMTNDLVLPWREDEYLTVLPLVTRREMPTAEVPNLLDSNTSPTTEQLALYDGSIKGSPLPAGSLGHFDFDHVTYGQCTGENGSKTWYPTYYGAMSGDGAVDISDGFVTPCATQWTDQLQASASRPGGWCEYTAGAYGNVLIVQKWAEIQIRRPGMDFGRPWGVDRLAVDQTTITCPGFTGSLRWPTAPAVAGRNAVVAVSNTTPIVVTVAEPTGLSTGDVVSIAGVTGNTAANGSWTVTVTSSVQFSLIASAGNGAWTGGGYAYIIGAPNYLWHDTNSKGYAVYASWVSNFRDIGEADRLGLTAPRLNQATWGMPQDVATFALVETGTAWLPCCPGVLAITPNGETWLNGQVFALSLDNVVDVVYGGRAQGAFVQHIVDPLWQVPAEPCDDRGDGCDWQADDGSGQMDACPGVGHFFAHPPMVEARIGLPEGAPALPSGVYLGWLSLAALDVTSEPSGNVLPPPGMMTSSLTAETPWGLYKREMGVVCATPQGRFAADYMANGVRC